VALVALVALLLEMFRGRDSRLAGFVRAAVVFVIVLEILVFFADKLVLTGNAQRGRGTHYEERLSDGGRVILRRSHGGMPVDFCSTAQDDTSEYRILFLGDSYTQGSGRAEACNYPDVVEEVLRNEWRANTRVVNAGVTAYGPVEALALFDWYHEKQCRFDAVVFNLFLENDFTDNLLNTERRVVAGVVFRFPSSWFLRTFHPLNSWTFRSLLYVAYMSRISGGGRDAVSVARGECDPDEEHLTELTPFLRRFVERRLDGSRRVASSSIATQPALDAVAQMRRQAGELGVPFILVVFPDRVLVDPELQGQMNLAENGLEAPSQIRRIVLDTFTDVPVVDATLFLDGRPGMYRRSDTHLSDLGNRVAGYGVGERLMTHFMMPGQTGADGIAKPDSRVREPEANAEEPGLVAAPARSAEAKREREAMTRAKTEAGRASTGDIAEVAYAAAAAEKEAEAERLLRDGDFDEAARRFGEARALYVSATEEARQASEQSQRGAEALQTRVQETRASMPADCQFLAEYQDGVALERDGDGSMANRRYATAARQYRSALTKYEEAHRAREGEVADIREVVGQYGLALEAEDLRALADLHTAFTGQMRDDWATLFEAADDLTAQISIDHIEFDKDGATTHLSVRFIYTGAGGSDESRKWDMMMTRRNGEWLIREVRK
jgi:hypothetical protein